MAARSDDYSIYFNDDLVMKCICTAMYTMFSASFERFVQSPRVNLAEFFCNLADIMSTKILHDERSNDYKNRIVDILLDGSNRAATCNIYFELDLYKQNMLAAFRLPKKLEYVLSVFLFNNFKCTIKQTHYLLTTGEDNPSIISLYHYFYAIRRSTDLRNVVV